MFSSEARKQAIILLSFEKVLRCGRVSHLAVVLRDAVRITNPVRDSSEHLSDAMEWLCRAQDASRTAGVSASYSLARGWEAPYPEVTGYIIPTFLDFYRLSGNDKYQRRALRMGEWLLSIQMPGGPFQAGYYNAACDNRSPSVFNSGQILLGLCRLYRETPDPRYRSAATLAGDWIVQNQDEDGAWYQGLSFHGPNTPVRTYYVRVAWALMELAVISDIERYREAAARNIRWALSQQLKNGWFCNTAFRVESNTFTHTIAYVLEGLLGYADHVDDPRCIEAVLKTASRLMHIFEVRGELPGEFDQEWKSTGRYRCLVGESQIAGIWIKLYALTGDARFLNTALKLLDRLKATQNLRSLNPGVRGGLKGSQPVYGRYHPMSFVSWGAKFFADGLLAEIEAMQKLQAGGEHE